MPLCDTYDFIPLSMRILKAAADLYPNDFELVKAADGQMHISRVTGSHEMERVLEGKKDLDSSALQSGNKILIWYQIATLSIPAQTNPDEIRVLP